MGRVWINPRSKIAHRDPGCARILVNGTGDGFVEHVTFPSWARRCFYCYSAAGRRRYPSRDA